MMKFFTDFKRKMHQFLYDKIGEYHKLDQQKYDIKNVCKNTRLRYICASALAADFFFHHDMSCKEVIHFVSVVVLSSVEDTGSFWPDHHHHHHLRHASVPLHPHHETCNPPFSPKSCAHKKYSSADCLTRNMQMKSGRCRRPASIWFA